MTRRVPCKECGATGVAEYFEGYARPCDACGGDGDLPTMRDWLASLAPIEAFGRDAQRLDGEATKAGKAPKNKVVL